MGFRIADRVQETTTTTGTGTLTLAGAATGFQSFAVVGSGNQTYYAIIDSTNNVWEVGIGTYTSAGTTLSRDTIFSNSSGTTAALTLAAGTKTVICTAPAQPTITDTIYGYQAEYNRSSTATNNTCIGYQAGYSISTNGYNTCVGYQAAYANSTSNSYTAVGYFALKGRFNAVLMTGVGISAGGGTTFGGGDYATCIGAYANYTSYGGSATAVGTFSQYSSLNNADCTSLGYGSLYTNGSGYRVTAIGSNAGYYISGSGIMESVAIGYKALYGHTTSFATGNYNTCVGSNSMLNVTATTYATVIGYSSMQNMTSASNNIGIGTSVGNSITTSSSNILIGYNAGATLSTSSDGTNIGIGYQAFNGGNGGYNIAIGFRTMFQTSGNTGGYNIMVGYLAGYSMAAGSYNVCIGGYQGSGGIIDITATNNNVVLGDNSGNILLYKVTSGLGGFNVGMADKGTTSATAATGTINFDAATQTVLYYTAAATANFTLNVRSTATATLNTALPTNQTLEIVFMCTNGATPYYMSAFTIDGTSVTPKWLNGTAPTTGNANSIDMYTLRITKTAGATYTVLAKQEKYA